MIRMTAFRCLMRRHPLARVALAVFGLVLIGLFSVLALAIGAVVFAVILIKRALGGAHGAVRPIRQTPRGAASTEVLEGEYRVIQHRNSQWTSPT
ncbi:hypothetical protein [Pseudomarimonas arenosa]|uniref:hypothetical protein n=1 Tax=Pseudomarimonas arenosa TaxID=2774145 RepID=UPI001CDB6CBA|nr:hypothetical protein [Pseudomarimonas arenosa]